MHGMYCSMPKGTSWAEAKSKNKAIAIVASVKASGSSFFIIMHFSTSAEGVS